MRYNWLFETEFFLFFSTTLLDCESSNPQYASLLSLGGNQLSKGDRIGQHYHEFSIFFFFFNIVRLGINSESQMVLNALHCTLHCMACSMGLEMCCP